MVLASLLAVTAFKCAFVLVVGFAALAYVPQWMSNSQRHALTRKTQTVRG